MNGIRAFVFMIVISECSVAQTRFSLKIPSVNQNGQTEERLIALPNGCWFLAYPEDVKLSKPLRMVILDSCLSIVASLKIPILKSTSIARLDVSFDNSSNIYFSLSIENRLNKDSMSLAANFGKISSNGKLKWLKTVEFDGVSFGSQTDLANQSFIAIENDRVYFAINTRPQFQTGNRLDFHVVTLDTVGNQKVHQKIRLYGWNNWPLNMCVYNREVNLYFWCSSCADGYIGLLKINAKAVLTDFKLISATGKLQGDCQVAYDEFGNSYVLDRELSDGKSVLFSLDYDGNIRWKYRLGRVGYHAAWQLLIEDSFLYLNYPNSNGNVPLSDHDLDLLKFNLDGQLFTNYALQGMNGMPIIAVNQNQQVAIINNYDQFELLDHKMSSGCNTYNDQDTPSFDTNFTITVKSLPLPTSSFINTPLKDTTLNFTYGWFKYTFNCNTGLFGSSLLADTLLCYGNELELKPEVFGDTAGIKYKWNTGATDKNLVTKQSGLYKLNITNGACSHNHETQVLMADEARALVPDSLELCPEDTGEIALNPLFKNSVYWYKPDSSIDENTRIRLKDEGHYYLNSYQAHCLEIDSVSVKTLNVKTLDAGQDSLICYGQEIGLNASGAKKYQWQPSSLFTNGNDTLANPNIKPKAYVKVKLRAINLNGCEEKDSILITVRDPLKIEIQQNDTSLCEGDSFEITSKASGGLAAQYQYIWDGNATKSDSFSLPLFTSQNVKVELKDQCSEPAFDSIQLNITEVEKAEIAYQPNPAMAGKIIQFSNPNKVYDSVKWLMNDTFFNQVSPNNHVFGKEGEYQITQLIYQKGCADSNLLTLTVGDQLIYFYPNAFSPNGDGINDEWFIKGHSIAYVDLRIFNIWGERIFWFEGPQVKWDGTFRDQPAPIGDYIFMATLTANNGEKVEVQGQFVLVK